MLSDSIDFALQASGMNVHSAFPIHSLFDRTLENSFFNIKFFKGKQKKGE
ncbi:hypothetical protein B4125_4541 [Bacillus paralicheniformis]|nr:hypothetical protein SC10_B2orf04426 [Bacillus paralicheniformis]OLF99863.1 hypothetical protein B4125_4541 [Bacillus paralicheniformis]TWJ66240.1 hypothetical protein CHCC5021_0516 [Bacillus paralicheniformis]TWL03938.1 hypothetical protein CHCC19468_0796 [Bacillus paralicheniformis]TWL09838.1 hypothetical protein CHCC19467_2110 [Bacillus paralicheniformis]